MATATALIRASNQTIHFTTNQGLSAKECTKLVGEYAGSGAGIHRIFQALALPFKWMSWWFGESASTGQTFSKNIQQADLYGLIPKLGFDAKEVVKAHEEYSFKVSQQQDGAATDDSVTAKLKEFVYKVIELVGDAMRVAMIWTPASLLMKVTADAADITVESGEISKGFAELDKQSAEIAKRRAQNVRAEELVRPTEEKRLHYIKIAKSACSATGAVLGLLGVIFKIALVPSVVLLTISTATVALAIWGHFYKETMTHKLDERFAQRRLELMGG